MSLKNKKWKARKRRNRDVLSPYVGEYLCVSGVIKSYTNTVLKGLTGTKRHMVLLTDVNIPEINEKLDHVFLIIDGPPINNDLNTKLTITAEVCRYVEMSNNKTKTNYRHGFRIKK